MPTKLSVTLEDDHGRTTNKVYGMETQTLLADYNISAVAFLTALEAVTDLGCVKASFIIPVAADPVWAAVTDANKDVGMTASGWVQAGEGSKASMKVPAIKYTLVGSDGTVAITGVVATFLALFENAADFTLAKGHQISAWIKATLDG